MNIRFGLFQRLPWCSSGKLLKSLFRLNCNHKALYGLQQTSSEGGSSNKFSENKFGLCNDALQDVSYDTVRMMEV